MNKLQQVIAGAQLEAIRLKAVDAKQTHLNAGDHEYTMELGHHPAVIKEQDGKRFLLSVHRLKLSSANPEKPAPIEMQIDMEAVYVLVDPAITEKDCAEFAAINVPFNLWPYFREFVQSTTTRMGLVPPLMLPLRKPDPPQVAKK